MQIRKISTIYQSTRKSNIRCICWSGNNRRLAVADSNGAIRLFDETGSCKDHFQTKSVKGEKGGKSYMITDMIFSPDSLKLAVSLSERLVYVFRLGFEWGEKKSICNKFKLAVDNAALCLAWPYNHPLKLVCGCIDGEVKMGFLQTNKTISLYRTDSPIVSLASSPDGHGFLSGHYDGSIHRYYFQNNDPEFSSFQKHTKICSHPVIPTCLAWGETIIVGTPRKKLLFLTIDGHILQQMDFSKNKEKEFSVIENNHSGQCFVIGSQNQLRVFNFNLKKNQWEEGEVQKIENLYAPTGLAWKPDGSKLIVGTNMGIVEMFDTCIKRYKYEKRFEFTFVTPSQVIVKRLDTGIRIVLKSTFGMEILKLYTKNQRFLIGHTVSTLLLGDLQTCKLSEVQWNSTGKEKFYFENPNICLVYNGAGDFYMIEYGLNDVTGSFRTDFISSALISVRILFPQEEEIEETRREDDESNQTKKIGGSNVRVDDDEEEDEEDDLFGEEYDDGASAKFVAYLSDANTIRVENLRFLSHEEKEVAKITNNEAKIDWLELSYRATKLLYRDQRGNLYLYDFATQTKRTLLTFCSYVQWVPNSDVVVAQSRNDLCVWYSIYRPEQCTVVPIQGGEVETIERANEQTTVIVSEGSSTIRFELNEHLIQFGTAMELGKYEIAAEILNRLKLTPETEAMWKNLADLLMKESEEAELEYQERHGDDDDDDDGYSGRKNRRKRGRRKKRKRKRYHIAERCYAAIGDVAKQRYLRKIVNLAYKEWQKSREEQMEDEKNGNENNMNNNKKYYRSIEEAYDHWSVRAKVAILNRNYSLAERIYVEHDQLSLAMKMYEELHMFEESIDLAFRENVKDAEKKKNDFIEWLERTQQREKAGKMYEKEGKLVLAIDQYLKGGFPSCAARVVEKHMGERGEMIHEKVLDKIGNKLILSKNFKQAGLFFERRGMIREALDNYRKGHYYHHAIELVNKYKDEENELKSKEELEEEFGDWLCSTKQMDTAINHFLQAKAYSKAVDASMKSSQYGKAQNILEDYFLPYPEHKKTARRYLIELAKHYERMENYEKAKRFYMMSNEHEYCMKMFKKAGMLEEALEVAEAYLPKESVKALYEEEAEKMKVQQKWDEAEKFYVLAGMVDKAIEMYKSHQLFDEAVRLIKKHDPEKLEGTLMGIALQHETHGQFFEAERVYVEAGAWSNAVGMYKKQDRWEDALRVAKLHGGEKSTDGDDETYVKTLIQWATLTSERESPEAGAQLLYKYELYEETITFSLDRDLFDFAFRIAQDNCPEKIPEVHRAYAYFLEEEGKFSEAEDQYIHGNSPKEAIEMYAHAGDWENAQRVAQSNIHHTELLAYFQNLKMNRRLNGVDGGGRRGRINSRGEITVSRDRDDEEEEELIQPNFSDDSISRIVVDDDENEDEDEDDDDDDDDEDDDEESGRRLGGELGEWNDDDSSGSSPSSGRGMVSMINLSSIPTNNKKKRGGGKGRKKEKRKTTKKKKGKQKKNSSSASSSSSFDHVTSRVIGFCEKHQFEKAREIVKEEIMKNEKSEESRQVQQAFVEFYIPFLIENGQAVKGISILSDFRFSFLKTMNVVPSNPFLKTCFDLAKNILWSRRKTVDVLRQLHHIFEELEKESSLVHSENPSSSSNSFSVSEIRKWIDVIHLTYMKFWIKEEGTMSIYRKICISLVRYIDILRPDEVLFDAGKAIHDLKEEDDEDKERFSKMEKQFYGRILDIYERMEEMGEEEGDDDDDDDDEDEDDEDRRRRRREQERKGGEKRLHGELEMFDEDGFEGTDIPRMLPIPMVRFCSEYETETFEHEVLCSIPEEGGMGEQQKNFPTIPCDRCKKDMYRASLYCPHCENTYQPCIVSGFPVQKLKKVECTKCHRIANRDEWNTHIMKYKGCPFCGEMQLTKI